MEDRPTTRQSTTTKFTEIRRAGILSNLDKRRSILENIKRQARETGQAELGPFKKEDLRYKTWQEQMTYESNAVVIAMMDVSGSMGEFKKYIARSFYFWMVLFLKTKYDHVKIVFISHHTEAKEVTNSSSSLRRIGRHGRVFRYRLALDVVARCIHPHDWNIYPFHFF